MIRRTESNHERQISDELSISAQPAIKIFKTQSESNPLAKPRQPPRDLNPEIIRPSKMRVEIPAPAMMAHVDACRNRFSKCVSVA